MEQAQDVVLDLLALTAQQLSQPILFQPFQSGDVRSEDKLVDSLDELFVELLDLHLLLRPVVRISGDIHAVNVLVVLYEGLYGVWREFEGDLIAQYHIHVNNVSLDMDKLVVEERFHERI